MPLVNNILESFKGARVFSSLDLRTGYWQVAMDEDSKRKIAFSTLFGLFQNDIWTASAMFQRAMEEVLGELRGISFFVYIYDIIINSRTEELYLKDLIFVQEITPGSTFFKPKEMSFFKTLFKIFRSCGIRRWHHSRSQETGSH